MCWQMSQGAVMAISSHLKPGSLVILTKAPATLLRGLPPEDKKAIKSIIGKPITLAGFSYGQAELEFRDDEGGYHSIWVETNFIKPAIGST
jgi:hypothetical protein